MDVTFVCVSFYDMYVTGPAWRCCGFHSRPHHKASIIIRKKKKTNLRTVVFGNTGQQTAG